MKRFDVPNSPEEIWRGQIAAQSMSEVQSNPLPTVSAGGSSPIERMCDLAEAVLGLPTRRAMPTRIGGLIDLVKSPSFSAGVGLVCHGAGLERAPRVQYRSMSSEPRNGAFKRVWSRLSEMF